MPEVSAFLAITAEEEAATALFLALKNKKYNRAKELNKKRHQHKGGVYPFLSLLKETILALKEGPTYELIIEEGPKASLLKLRHIIFIDGEYRYFYPDPPLNLFSLDSMGKAQDYFEGVKSIAVERGILSIRDHIEKVANIRNTILYASDSSLPNVSNVEEMLSRHIGAALIIQMIYLLVVQNKKQNLVEQCLDVFLSVQCGFTANET
ncbi:hypothetical protein VV1_2535 [Vibrio vulnificus CMCP6]|uniref:Uncharacterized protein n=2 Tax=Vibrio vulnificus TaxID=672 RepID=A0A3Q0L620_VIBVU|nr:hypothetical protein VV1_2535 [Vibrio vulnificus CMCP6]